MALADQPRQQQPYANMISYVSYGSTNPPTGKSPGQTPTGPQNSKRALAEMALRGLKGAR